jgi:hypothetical protein
VTGADPDEDRLAPWQSWVIVAAAGLAFAALWWSTLGTTPTHDEVIYLDVAEHPFTSTFYPGDTFLRHPPMGLALLSGWLTLGLAARAWPLVWTLAGLGLLGDAIHQRGRSPLALAAIVLAAPVALPLATVTLYPPLFFFLALAAWGWARDRRDVETVAWNLAVFTHELALLVLAVLLAVRAAGLVRERNRDLRSWARLVWPYPAAIAWGAVMVGNLAVQDGRGDYLATLLDPSPNVASIIQLTPWVGLVILAVAVPLLADPREAPSGADRGLWLATIAAAIAAPFYRYVLPIATLAAGRGTDGPRLAGDGALVLAALLATGAMLGTTLTGNDPLNAANMPGLVDHEEARELVGPGETVVVRSTPSFAHALADEGWRVAATAPTGPATVELARGEEDIVLHRAETYARLHEVGPVDAVVLPAVWSHAGEDLPGDWTRTDTAGGAARWEPAGADDVSPAVGPSPALGLAGPLGHAAASPVDR